MNQIYCSPFQRILILYIHVSSCVHRAALVAYIDAIKLFKILKCYLLLVERIFADGLRTADGVEVLSGHQTAAEEQSDCKQQLEHLDDSW
jgi:hypothetical protein